MKKIRGRLVCFALALCFALTLLPSSLFEMPAQADSSTYGMTLKDKVILRYGASTGAKMIFYMPASHVCTIKERKTVAGVIWYKVTTTNPETPQNDTVYSGYVHGDFFRPLTDAEEATYLAAHTLNTPTPIPDNGGGEEPTPTPTPAPVPGYLDAQPGTTGRVTNSGTNFRSGPGTNHRPYSQLDANTQVEVLQIPTVISNGTFYKIRYNGTEGYIMSTFIAILSGGPVNGETTTPTPTPAAPDQPTPTPTPTPAPDQPTPTPTNGGNTSGYTHVRLILSSCHLRKAPNGDYDAANDWTGQGTVLPLAGNPVKKGNYTWYPVSKGGVTYYVRNDCVQPFTDGETPTPAPDQPTPTPEPTVNPAGLGWVMTIKGGVNLRMTISGTVIKQIAKNVTMPYLLEPVKKNGYTWYFVQAGENRGYVRGDMVKVVSAPVVTDTPTPAPDVTPTAAPTEQPATGYIKTTTGGVNLRKKAGYTDIIGQVAKNAVLPYYGEPTTVKGVTWYYVKHPTLGAGYLHANYLTLCNSDGSPLATPTPEPGETVSPGGSGQEASYNTLKLGSTGTAVLNLTTELKNQGYYSGAPGRKYTTAVQEAVRAFQKAKGLTADGIAGPATQHALFGTVPIGSGDNSNLTMVLYPAEKIDWYTGGINELWKRGDNYKVYDVKTGIVWWAHRWAGGLHIDAEPLTAADTARLCRCYGVTTSQEIKDKNLYERRPLLVTIGTRTFACSLYGVPHNYPEGDTISNNDYRGQLCIHFTNSQTHASRKVDTSHEEAIEYAWQHAPNGHK